MTDFTTLAMRHELIENAPAHTFGLLNTPSVDLPQTRALVLYPPLELADQVAQALRQFAGTIPNVKLIALCGGATSCVPAISSTH